MNRTRLAILWLLSSAALASATSWLVLHRHVSRAHHDAGQGIVDSESQFHAWVHEHLHLTPAQNASLHATEDAFAARRQALRGSLRQATDALRAAILQDRRDTPLVQAAVADVATAQAALQQAILAHIFEMAEKLDPAQKQQLFLWFHDSLQPAP